jgi:hypothetical protein
MNCNDSLRLMVASYPGGREAMAVRLGITDELLRKELSGAPSHKLGVGRAELISEICIEAQSENCYAYVNALNARSGKLLELPVIDMVDKQDIRAGMARMLKECSDAVLVLTKALDDDTISDNEMRQIQHEVLELLASAQSVLNAARSNNAASKPTHLRAAA